MRPAMLEPSLGALPSKEDAETPDAVAVVVPLVAPAAVTSADVVATGVNVV